MKDLPPIRLVLDSTAILAFVRQSFDVGEVLSEIGDNAAVAALPLACLVEAARDAVDQDRLHLLAEHPSTVVVSAEAADWRTLAALCSLIGGYAPATAALAAMDSGCWVLSTKPDLYAHVAGGELAIPVHE